MSQNQTLKISQKWQYKEKTMNSGMGSGASTPIAVIEKPSEETLEKIDFVIQGVENGLFKELSKKIDFHQKLKGEDPTKFVQSLLLFVEDQQKCIHDLQISTQQARNDFINAENRITELENLLTNHTRDMRGVAAGLATLSRPDPFGMDYSNNVDVSATEQFINDYKSKY